MKKTFIKILMIVGVIAAIVLFFVYPYFRLYTEGNELISTDGYYEVTYYTKEQDSEIFNLKHEITGTKEGLKINGILDDNQNVSFFYNSQNGELLLNAMQCCLWAEQGETNWIVKNLNEQLSDVYISQEQLRRIVGDFQDIDANSIKEIITVMQKCMEAKISFRKQNLPKEYGNQGKYFFEIEDISGSTNCYIGVDKFPQYSNNVTILIENSEETKKIQINYKPDKSAKVIIPETGLSNDLVDILSEIYQLYDFLKTLK